MRENLEDKPVFSYSLKLYALKKYFKDFTELYKKKKLPKVILLTGDKGVGKQTLSFHLINYFLTINTDSPYNLNNMSINQNNIQFRNIQSNVCENYNYIGNEKTKKVKIDDIRNIQKKFINTPLNNLPRFTVIDDVELLNLNTANSLLKFIENPSEFDFFILINNKRGKIIETIRSRSLETKIFLSEKEKEEIFKSLLEDFGLKYSFSHNYIKFSTPGLLLNISQEIEKLGIKENMSLYKIAEILLNSFKKNKNDISLECIKLFMDIRLMKNLKETTGNTSEKIYLKNTLINLLNKYQNYNLTNNLVLEHFKAYPDHVG